MRIEALLPRDDCIKCPDPLPCNCAANEDCIVINRDCVSCSQTKCVPRSGSPSKGSGGASKGATAGAIVGVLIFLGTAVAIFLWYRRKTRLRRRLAAAQESSKDIPAPAETVLKRPDPTEKPPTPSPTELSTVRVYSTSSDTTIDLDPESQRSSPHYNPSRHSNTNPFDDATSIQTAGTEGTNVIPIALVPADSQRALSPTSDGHTQLSEGSTLPVRPPRSPDLNLDHVNVSRDSVRGPAAYAPSTISGITNRHSYMTSASFSSEFLNEAPMIMTPNKAAVRQVLGVVKAEVINAPGSHSSGSDSLKPPSASRPTVGSPLASTSFGPADVLKEADESQAIDPFSDEASVNADYGASPAPTTTTFGHSSTGAVRDSHSEWIPETPNVPWAHSKDNSRPSSMSTQAGSVIDIGSATRVQVGLSGYTVASSQLSPDSARSAHRTTMGRLISPSSPDSRNMQDQQQRALAQAQAQTQGSEPSRRVSTSSAMSATSTRADSILEAFPFVPPSPISNRPIRSPPVSPLGQQSFTANPPPSPLGAQHTINIAPPSPVVQQEFTEKRQAPVDNSALPAPPDRRTLGLSTGSQLSTASSGLGSFPFQIDSGDGPAPSPSSFNNRQRASLDTLALTSDLSSYPLGFDRDSVQVPMPPSRKS
ncbi:hypothetical protein LshimejAT787_0106680 [Lyophyllum shimeji]|uniref:Membrane anchor Opy2 N-terminal domain-containing protein n=1 Tax=Lyophyllum shimeji TaxID=47721 RepID=A0A9P3PDU6_LYOSH|nr:hypothetical protein LshimejAT787_0106680 [Lyophyllum shimeji]